MFLRDQEIATMPRPKRKPTEPKAEPRRAAKQIGIASTPEWAEWVREGAEFCRTDVAKLIDSALALYLRNQGFPKKPPPRV